MSIFVSRTGIVNRSWASGRRFGPVIICLLCHVAPLALTLCAAAAAEGEDSFASNVRTLLQQHCVKCHGEDGRQEADVNLLELRSVVDLSKDADLVQRLIDVIEFEEMPPEEEPQPEPQRRRKLVQELKSILQSSVSAKATYKHTPLRRMNRFQYNNAVQDLLQLNCVVFSLPEKMMREYRDYFQPQSRKMPDEVTVGSRPLGKSQMIERRLAGVAAFPQDLRAEHGFDNRGDHLSLSPLLLESFFKLSRTIVESPDFGPKTCGIWNSFFLEPKQTTAIQSDVSNRLRLFLTRAFRHPADEKLVDRYTSHVMDRLRSGESFTDSMKAVASAAIASPRFLYLYDRASASDSSELLDDFDLATRLSFFLWGSIPDQTLLDLAASGSLNSPDVLSAQVDRMLDDRRLKRFCDSFPAQWLQLDRIISSTPSRERFPDFYISKYRASMHMTLEPLLLFETVLIEDSSILKLIDPEFSYRSDRLVSHYDRNAETSKRNHVTSIPFRRVMIRDRREGGVITNAAVMTMTSGPERTKPITRGAWLATVIFNNPPDPPPADVPPLSEEPSEMEQQLTFRERLAAHRQRADCAGCHEKIDPLGFALENFGPTGQWRDTYENGRSVDMDGTLFRRHPFNDIAQFKDAILAEKDQFTRAFASHMLSFALARDLDAADSPAIDRIAAETAASGYRIRRLIKQVILSDPFRQKTNPKTIASAAGDTTVVDSGTNSS